MRVRAFIGAAIAAICLGSTSSGNAAEDKTVEACLTGSAYLDAAETVDQCDKALRVADISPRTRSAVNLQIGEAFYFAGRPGIAIPYLDEAIQLDHKSGQAGRRRGWSQLRLENISAAIADFTEFLALSPDDPDALLAIAFARDSTTHNCAAAASDYERMLEHHPGHYLTRKALAGEYACIDGHGMRQLQELNKILAAGQAAGQFALPDPKLATLAIIAMLNGVNTWYRADGRLSRDAVVLIYRDMVRKALAA